MDQGVVDTRIVEPGTAAEGDERTRGRRLELWILYLALGALALGVYFFLSGSSQDTLYNAIAASSVVAVLVGVRRYAPARKLPWYLFAAGSLSFAVGEVLFWIYEDVLGRVPFPSAADAFFLLGYPFFAGALLLLLRSRAPGRDWSSLIDASIITTSAAVVVWVFLMQPYFGDESLSLVERLLSCAYPLGDLLLLAVAVRLAVAPGVWTFAYRLLWASLAFRLLADIVFADAVLNGTYTSGDPVDAGWLLAYLLIGAAALHPSMRTVSVAAPGPNAGLTIQRLALLASASLMAPGMMVAQLAMGDRVDPVIVAGSVILFLLVVVRMAGMIRERERAEAEVRRLNDSLERRVAERTVQLEATLAERERAEMALRAAHDQLEARVAERTAELARANRDLERSNGELQDFASVASHDLQEPLRKIQAFGDRLKARHGDELGPKGQDYLERMQAAAGRMQTLINDLLSFSRVTTRARPFVPVDVGGVVGEVLSDLETRIEQTGGRVEIGDLPTIDADPMQMRQLMQNLIGNALKFHREGEPPVVTIRGRVLENGDAEGWEEAMCEITVEDNGIGFDQKYADRIFTVFQRLHGRGQYEGTGVGLAICRKIVERHNGKLAARSVPGEGTLFTMTLPIEQPEGDHGDE